jgi:hypothetical protein
MATKPDRSGMVVELEQAAIEDADRRAALEDAERDLFGLPVVLPQRGRNAAEPADRAPKQVRRRTLVSVRFLLEKFGNPIEGLLRMASYDVDDLAVFLQCSRHDAWIEKRLLLALAAPYVVSKMPQGMVVAPVAGLRVTGFNFGAAGDAPAERSDVVEHLEDEVRINGAGEAVVEVEPEPNQPSGLAWNAVFGNREDEEGR